MDYLLLGLVTVAIGGIILSALADFFLGDSNAAAIPGVLLLYYLGWHGFDNYEPGVDFLTAVIILFFEFGFFIPANGVNEIGAYVAALIAV